MKDRFTQEEANEILLRAIETQPVGREMTRQQLESLAAEVGISPDALQVAEDRWQADHVRESDDRQVFQAMQRAHQLAITRFVIHLCLFLFFAFIFFMVSMEEGSEGLFIALAFMVPWFIALWAHGSRTFASSAADQEKAFRKWQQARHLDDGRDASRTETRRLIR